MATWQDNLMTLITVSLYDSGYERYEVVSQDSAGKRFLHYLWARNEDAITQYITSYGHSVLRSEPVRDLFWAQARQIGTAWGSISKEALPRLQFEGDHILYDETGPLTPMREVVSYLEQEASRL